MRSQFWINVYADDFHPSRPYYGLAYGSRREAQEHRRKGALYRLHVKLKERSA